MDVPARRRHHAELADRVGISVSSIERLFGSGELTLPRLAAFCAAAGTTLEDVLQQSLEPEPFTDRLTDRQERHLVADPRTLPVGLRSWELGAFAALRRPAQVAPDPDPDQGRPRNR